MTAKPVPRRKAFDDITMGWGSDSRDELMARMELLVPWWVENFPLVEAEHKVARAMHRRMCELGGIPFNLPQ